MFAKLLSLLKMVFYKIKYKRKINFKGIPSFAQKRKQINIKDGEMNIGKGFSPKPEVYFAVVNGGHLSIGDFVAVNRNCMIICHDSISIGDGCSIGPNTLIYDHDHKFGRGGIQPGYNTAPVVIEKNCWIGAGVTILRGTHIGEGCVIGAGCVVSGDVPAHSLVTSDRSLTIRDITSNEKTEGEGTGEI